MTEDTDPARFEAEMLADGHTWDDLRRSSDQAAAGVTVPLDTLRAARKPTGLQAKIEEQRPGWWRLSLDPLSQGHWTSVAEALADTPEQARIELMGRLRDAVDRASMLDHPAFLAQAAWF